MNLISDWRFWLFTVSIIKDFVLVLGVVLIKFNDMKHLERNVNEIKLNLDKVKEKLENVEKLQSAQIAVCDERHGIKR